MNLVLLFESDFETATRVRLSGRRLQHLRSVIKPEIGDTVTVGLLNAKMGEGLVLSMTDESVELEVELNVEPPPALPVSLFLALPRPKALFRSLQVATTLGVKEIHLINGSRVEKSFWLSKRLEQEAMREHLILGLEQARDTVLPTVRLHRLFAPLVNDVLPELVEGKAKYVAHPSPGASPCPRSLDGPTALAIGPEGGFIEYEVRRLIETGFELVALGPRILRVEQAIPALLGRMFD